MVPFRIFAPFAFGYFLSYLFRVVNAVAGPEISNDLGIDPAALGFLTSVYFLTFAAIQLPLGVLLDRYGANRVEAVLLVLAGIGAAVFALGNDLATLTIGRALIGLGVSACLMAAFKAYATLVPVERLPFVNGLHLAVGGLGLLAGGLPSEMAMGVLGWRGLFLLLAALSIIEAVALLVFARTTAPAVSSDTVGDQFRGVGRVLVSPAFLRLAPVSTAAQMTALAMQSLWVGPWLRQVAGLDSSSAAFVLSVMALATTVGFIASGSAASALARRGYPITTVSVSGIALLILVQPLIVLFDPAIGVGLWVVFAFLAAVPTLTYPALTAAFPASLAGRVNTALNFTVFVAAFATQWAIGVVVARLTPDLGSEGAFDVAMGVLIAIQFAALGWYIIRARTVKVASSSPVA